MAADNITRHGQVLWEWANGVVVRIWVLPPLDYPAPTAPTPWPSLFSVPEPLPLLAMTLALTVTSIVAGILVWWYGFRRNN